MIGSVGATLCVRVRLVGRIGTSFRAEELVIGVGSRFSAEADVVVLLDEVHVVFDGFILGINESVHLVAARLVAVGLSGALVVGITRRVSDGVLLGGVRGLVHQQVELLLRKWFKGENTRPVEEVILLKRRLLGPVSCLPVDVWPLVGLVRVVGLAAGSLHVAELPHKVRVQALKHSRGLVLVLVLVLSLALLLLLVIIGLALAGVVFLRFVDLVFGLLILRVVVHLNGRRLSLLLLLLPIFFLLDLDLVVSALGTLGTLCTATTSGSLGQGQLGLLLLIEPLVCLLRRPLLDWVRGDAVNPGVGFRRALNQN